MISPKLLQRDSRTYKLTRKNSKNNMTEFDIIGQVYVVAKRTLDVFLEFARSGDL